jgi:O-antigen/teichoic acid export membrane protein
MSHEGLTLVMRAALVISMVIVGAFFHALVGPSRKRGEIMLVGTLGGMSFGVLLAYLVSPWLMTDESAAYACLGMTIGWGVVYLFARRIPREAR